MKSRLRPETLVTLASLLFAGLVLVLFYLDLAHARQRELDEAGRRVNHFSMMVAENTARSFEVVEIVLREMALDLSQDGGDWQRWPAERAWNYLGQRHARALPVIKSLGLVDPAGTLRASSDAFPAPRFSLANEPRFAELQKGQAMVTFGPYVAPGPGRYVYGMARRIDAGDGSFKGAAMAAIDPIYLQDFCWPARLAEEYEAMLVNADNAVVASCRPSDLSAHSTTIGLPVDRVLFGGDLRGQIGEGGLQLVNGYLVAVAPIPAYAGLAVVSAVPQAVMLRDWQARRNELMALGTLIVALILSAGWLLRRHLVNSGAMTRQLAENQVELERCVAEATSSLIEQRNAAERANRGKSRFLAAASHDLRQPLHALSLFAADLQHQVRLGQTGQLSRLAEQIAHSTQILGELLDALLDLSRLDVQGAQPDIVHFPLQPMFDRIFAAQRRSAVDRQITLRFRPSAAWVHTDPTMLERMVANLVSNALRYTPVRGNVLVAARRAGEHLRIEVRDSGVGIPREHQEAIFSEFYQIGNAAREHGKGLGLGLSIVDRLARLLKIEVGLRSLLGRGTVFSLKVARGCPQQPAATANAVAAGPVVHALGESEALQTALAMIKGWGYAICKHADVAGLQGAENLEGWLLVDAGQAVAVDALGLALPIIVLAAGGEGAPALHGTAHVLSAPVRPAKLRALLRV